MIPKGRPLRQGATNLIPVYESKAFSAFRFSAIDSAGSWHHGLVSGVLPHCSIYQRIGDTQDGSAVIGDQPGMNSTRTHFFHFSLRAPENEKWSKLCKWPKDLPPAEPNRGICLTRNGICIPHGDGRFLFSLSKLLFCKCMPEWHLKCTPCLVRS